MVRRVLNYIANRIKISIGEPIVVERVRYRTNKPFKLFYVNPKNVYEEGYYLVRAAKSLGIIKMHKNEDGLNVIDFFDSEYNFYSGFRDVKFYGPIPLKKLNELVVE